VDRLLARMCVAVSVGLLYAAITYAWNASMVELRSKKHTLADDDLTGRLRIVRRPGEPPVYRFTLDDLEELAGYVAAEANHAKNKELERQLHWLYARIAAVLDSYTDETDGSTR